MTRTRRFTTCSFALAAFLAYAALVHGREKNLRPHFTYVAGTEDFAYGCTGSVQLTTSELIFRCREHSIPVPYGSVSMMQYRPNISKKVRKLGLNWKISPPHG